MHRRTALPYVRALGSLAIALSQVLASLPLRAQEPLLVELRDRIKSDPISFGALFQFVGDFQAERTFPGQDGFSVANFRFIMSGRLDRGVDYLLVSNFGGLLDARVGLSLHPSITLDAGRFKAPYSREFLTGGGDIDFVSRSQSVTALAPGRALGAALRGPLGSGFNYSVGMFNGGGGVSGNARGEYAGVARLGWTRGGIELAVNGAWNDDHRVVGELEDPTFATLRGLIGADLRITRGPLLVSAELDRGTDKLGTARDPWGGFVTAGYMVNPRHQVLMRLDHFDTGRVGDRRILLIGGWNYSPSSPTQVQINAVFPVDGFQEEPRLLVNLELAL